MSPGKVSGGQGNLSYSPGVITGILFDVTVAPGATKYALFTVISSQFHKFIFPGISGNINPFLHTFPGIPRN